MTVNIVIDRVNKTSFKRAFAMAFKHATETQKDLTVFVNQFKEYKNMKNNDFFARIINEKTIIIPNGIKIDKMTFKQLKSNYDETETYRNDVVFIADITINTLDIFKYIDNTGLIVANEFSFAAAIQKNKETLDKYYDDANFIKHIIKT